VSSNPTKDSRCCREQKLNNPHCLVLVGSRNGLDCDLQNPTKMNLYKLTQITRMPYNPWSVTHVKGMSYMFFYVQYVFRAC